jgi:hypothetical protein
MGPGTVAVSGVSEPDATFAEKVNPGEPGIENVTLAACGGARLPQQVPSRSNRSSPNFALGPSAALAHRHVGVGKDAGHDAARAYQ